MKQNWPPIMESLPGAPIEQYTIATIPNPSTLSAGTVVYISDATGSTDLAKLRVSNGTYWYRVTQGTYDDFGVFSPLSLSNLLAWHNPAGLASITNGAVIDNWVDASGANVAGNMIPINNSNKPVKIAAGSGPNNNAYVNIPTPASTVGGMVGANAYTSLPWFTGTAFTVYAIMRAHAGDNYYRRWISGMSQNQQFGSGATGYTAFQFQMNWNGDGTSRLYGYTGSGGVDAAHVPFGNPADFGWRLLKFRFDGTKGYASWANAAESTTNNAFSSAFNINRLVLGADPGDTGAVGPIDVAEVAFYGRNIANGDADDTSLRSYFASKFAVTT